MAVVGLDLGLGGIFKDRLINETHIVSAWALKEITPGALTCKDFAFDRNPLVYVNAEGFTRAVSSTLPEGALGVTFDGVGHLEAPDDGDGYARPGDASERNLSVADGGCAFPVHFATTDSGATLRCLLQKQETDSSGVGWHVGLQNGAVVFYLRTAGGVVFNFARGAVADGAEHTAVAIYDPSSGEAWITIDGVQAGDKVTSVTEEPDLNTGDFRIGAFNDGSGRLTDATTVWYAAVSRDPNPALPALLQATRAWTDVSAHMRSFPLHLRGGMTGLSLRDRQAGAGSCNFTLDNGYLVPDGTYTIGHANQQANFNLGIPVRLRITSGATTHIFRYTLQAADPEAGQHKGKRVQCFAEDWLAVARVTPSVGVPIQLNVRSDVAWAALIDRADVPPVAVRRQAGNETFPFALDRSSEDTVILQDMADVCASGFEFCYMVHDTVLGGVLVFEPRGTRQIDTTPVATFTNNMDGVMPVEISTRAIINRVDAVITPRQAGELDTDVLFRTTARIRVGPKQQETVTGGWQDPEQSRSRVGATDFQALDPGVDYTMFTDPEGEGIDITDDLAIVEAELGGSGPRIVVVNTGIDVGYVYLQVRGRVLRTDDPLPARAESKESIRRYGPRRQRFDFPYLNTPAVARGLAQIPIALFSGEEPIKVPGVLPFRPEQGSALEQTVLGVHVGDLVAVVEPQSALAATTRLWVQNYDWTIEPGGLVRANFGVFPSWPTAEGAPIASWDGTTSLWDFALFGV